MVTDLQNNIPGIGIYIWNYDQDNSTGNTQHTIISSNLFARLEDGISVGEWILNATEGDVASHGLHLLDE
jgi:hypothetical protein